MPVKLRYLYHPETGEFSGSEAVIPGKKYDSSTTTPPPETGGQEKAFWDGKSWKLIPDYRRKGVWNKKTGKRERIKEVGKLPADLTDKAPPPGQEVIFNTKEKKWMSDKKHWIDVYVRPKRDALLASSDKFMTTDFPLSDQKRQKWREFRQELRNLPETIDQKEEKWPSPPQ